MLKVKNRGVVREIARRTYQANKKRNLLTVFAIILTTLLLSLVVVFGSTYWEALRTRSIRTAGMDYDIELTEPREDQVELIRAMDDRVSHAGLCVKCAIAEQYRDRKLSKERLYYVDKTCWETQVMPALEEFHGAYPQKEQEVVFSINALTDMGIKKPELGMELPLSGYTLAEGKENDFQKTMVLSGYYKDYSGKAYGYVSKAFWKWSGVKQTDFTQGSLKITLKNPLYSERDILAMQKELNLKERQYIIADTDIISYFCKMVLALFGIFLMVLASGCLFIYNSLYIFISRDIRYYGQLKTIGMTSKQLKQVIYFQTAFNSAIGIPIGLLISIVISGPVISGLIKLINPELTMEGQMPERLWVFFFAGAFAFFINIISSQKPAKLAADCSPVEALRYTAGAGKGKEKSRKRENGGLYFLAWQNLFRDKKQAVVIFSSFMIAISLFFVVNIVIRGNDGKRILNELMDYDLCFVNQTMLEEEEREVITEEHIQKIKEIPGVESVRKVTSSEVIVPYQEEVYGQYYKELYEGRYSPGNYEKDMQAYKENQEDFMRMFDTRLIGIDEEGFALLNEKAGNVVDKEDFEAGRAAMSPNFWGTGDSGMTGKTVHFFLPDGIEPKQEHSIKIAYVGDKYFNPATFSGGYTAELIVSQAYAEKLLGNTTTELIYVTYKNAFDKKTEKAVKKVFAQEKELSAESKLNSYLEMRNMEKQIKILGNSLGFLIAFLAIMNYLNMMAASVQSRVREFTIMESIGMTGRQIKKMLMLEGFGYAFISSIASLGIGIPLGYVVFDNLKVYQNACSIPWNSNLAVLFAIHIVCLLLPVIIYQKIQKGSVMARLRESETL